MRSIFETVREAVSVPEAAAFYGLSVSRSGMACCLFHPDRHPSMKLFPDHYYCFSCHAHGDVSALAAKILGLSFREAAGKLAEDFGIHPRKGSGSTGTRGRRQMLNRYIRLLRSWKEEYEPSSPEGESPDWRFVLACRELPRTEHLQECLNGRDEADRAWAERELEDGRMYERMAMLLGDKKKEEQPVKESLPEEGEERDSEQKEIRRIRELLERTEKGAVANTLRNCRIALEQDPLLKGAIRLNLLTGQTDLVLPVDWPRSGSQMTETDRKYIEYRLEGCYGLSVEKKISKVISIVANENRYHPVTEYLNGLAWDGIPRIRYALHHFLGAEVNDFNEECLRVYMSGAVKRVFEPGCKFDLMLCLAGGQGAGKSSFFRLLAVRDEWFTDDLKKLDDENVYRKMQGHWIIEMPEMIATSNARSIEDIKAFLSRQKETYKVPYEVNPEDRPRQCVFAGTSNRLDFLPRDRTGNRRFLPVYVCPEKAEQHPMARKEEARKYVEQMWAEIMEDYRAGKCRLYLSEKAEQALRDRQQDFMQEDPKAETIRVFIRDYEGNNLCSKLLYREALRKNNEPEDWETREICEIVNTGIACGTIPGWRQFRNSRRFGAYGTQRGWERIDARNEG